jgi:hypothetical protein
VRPQIWTTLCFMGFLAILLRYRRVGPDGRLWLLPPLMLLWANFHAGFTVGLLLLGAFVVGEAAHRLLGGPAAPLRPLLAVTAACAAVSLLTPNGLDLWLYPLTYLGGTGGNASLRFVQEWQPPDLRSVRSLPFLAALLGLLALNLVRTDEFRVPSSEFRVDDPTASPLPAPGRGWGRGADVSLMIALVGFTAMALQALRFVPLFALVWAVAVTVRLAALWPGLRDRTADPLPPEEAARRQLLGGVNLAFYALIAGGLAVGILSNPRAQVHAAPLAGDYPAGAVAYLAAPTRPLPAPLHLFHDYGWGGYLIAHRIPVFVDGRADPYGSLLDEYVAASAGTTWETVFAKYGVNAVLLRPGSTLLRILATTPGWTQVYADPGSVVYIKP